MNSKKFAFAVLMLQSIGLSGISEARPVTLYVRKGWYLLHSALQAQADLKTSDFQRKYPTQLQEYGQITETVAPYSNVPKSNLTKDQQSQLNELLTRKRSIEGLIGPEYEALNKEVQELNLQRDLLFGRSVLNILDKLNAGKIRVEGVKVAPDAWYYITPQLDVTDLVIAESDSRPWDRKFSPSPENLERVYYVSQIRVLEKFSDMGDKKKEFAMEFYEACRKAAEDIGADMVIEEAQSGIDFIEASLDLTDIVTTEMLKKIARR